MIVASFLSPVQPFFPTIPSLSVLWFTEAFLSLFDPDVTKRDLRLSAAIRGRSSLCSAAPPSIDWQILRKTL